MKELLISIGQVFKALLWDYPKILMKAEFGAIGQLFDAFEALRYIAIVAVALLGILIYKIFKSN